jgi:hypothetical protein
MDQQAGATDVDRVLPATGAPVFFGKLRKRNRRRILVDPASKFFNPRVVGHERYGTATALMIVLTRPRLSVSLNLTL